MLQGASPWCDNHKRCRIPSYYLVDLSFHRQENCRPHSNAVHTKLLTTLDWEAARLRLRRIRNPICYFIILAKPITHDFRINIWALAMYFGIHSQSPLPTFPSTHSWIFRSLVGSNRDSVRVFRTSSQSITVELYKISFIESIPYMSTIIKLLIEENVTVGRAVGKENFSEIKRR